MQKTNKNTCDVEEQSFHENVCQSTYAWWDFQKQNASVAFDAGYHTELASESGSAITDQIASTEESNVFNLSGNFSSENELLSDASVLSFLLMVVHIFLFALLFLLLLWYPLKSWWEAKNIRSAADPTSPFSHLPLPPGSFGLPIIGETFQWITQGSQYNSIRRKKYGNIFKSNTIGLPIVRVTGQEYVKQVLHGEHDKVTTIWPINVRQILGINGLINSVGAIHRMKRKITCKAFSTVALNSYIPLFHHIIKDSVNSLSQCKEPRVHDKLNRLTYDLAASALIGLDSEKTGSNELVELFYALITNVFSVPLKIPGFGFVKALKARELLLDRLQGHITEKKNNILKDITEKEDGDATNDHQQKNVKTAFDIIVRELILEQLSAQQNNNNSKAGEASEESKVESIDDLTLKEIVIELIFAGYATSGSALTSCVLELARHPNVIKKLEEELFQNGLLKDEGDESINDDLEIDLQLIHKLTYMENVLKETLRLRPPALGGYRKAVKTFQLGEYRVPKGWTVIYNIRDTHEFEYEATSEFNPERFESKTTANDKYKFIPFGGGARMCIGREYARLIIKLTLIEIIRTYKHWELVNPGLPKMKAIPVLHPTDGLPCNFYPREKFGVISR